jgi:hypothetical protein
MYELFKYYQAFTVVYITLGLGGGLLWSLDGHFPEYLGEGHLALLSYRQHNRQVETFWDYDVAWKKVSEPMDSCWVSSSPNSFSRRMWRN